MDARRFAFVSLAPAVIVAARFLAPDWGAGSWARAFAILGFGATLVGCAISAWACRGWLAGISYARLLAVAVFTAVVPLVVVFPSMPHWPFTGIGFVVAWCLISGSLCAASLFVAHRVHA